MKLIIKRGYVEGNNGFLGGKSERFTIYFKAELTPEESILVEKYKLNPPSTTEETSIGDELTVTSPPTIVDGFQLYVKYINELADIESNIVESCKKFQVMINNFKLIGTVSVLYFSNESEKKDLEEKAGMEEGGEKKKMEATFPIEEIDLPSSNRSEVC